MSGGPDPFPCGCVGCKPCKPINAAPINRLDSNGMLTTHGARWDEIVKQTFSIAKAQFLKEYPGHQFEDQ